MQPAERPGEIERRLRDVFQPESLQVEDESHLHAGHAGARDGRGHFRVSIISEAFEGLSLIRRHRLVYEAMGSLMETDIHALSIEAIASSEF
ncbi:MAG: BolA family transcriptional regulator [Xanthomonadales bacterium]|nr:BolA family transcriptional regulator [Xanthomonadales bacterium]